MSTPKVATPASDITDCSLQVRIAKEPWEKRAIYKLRYQVYVQEMGKPLGSTVNKQKQIFDEMDDKSTLLYVQAGAEIVATIRLTIATVEDYPADLATVFHMHKFKELHTNNANPLFGLGTKLTVTAEYRNSPALYLILVESYKLLREQRVQICFTGCNPYLIGLYERMGFRKFTKNFTDPGYGLLVPLVAILEDTEHVVRIKSPLYRHVRRYANDVATSQKFLQAFPESFFFHSLLATQESLWDYVERSLNISPLEIPIFQNLNKENVISLLLAGSFFSCTQGDRLITLGSICNDLYILLSGTLVSTSSKGTHTIHPGEYLSGLSLPGQSRQNASVSALSACELFVLPLQVFSRYQYLNQQAAATLLNNSSTVEDSPPDCLNIQQGGPIDE